MTVEGEMMREVARVLVSFLLPSMLLAQTPSRMVGRWCAPNSTYESGYKENVAALRWSLYSLVKAGADPDVKRLIPGLTDASIISLVNIYSLRAHFLRDCRMSPEVYYREMAANTRFVTLLLHTTSRPDFPGAALIVKTQPELYAVESAFSVVADAKPVFDAVLKQDLQVRQAISKWMERAGGSNNALRVAGSQLLEGPIPLNESQLVPIVPLWKRNPEPVLKQLQEGPSGKAFDVIDELGWKKSLQYLSNYYLQ